MRKYLFSSLGALAAVLASAAFTALPAQATTLDTSWCPSPTLTRLLLPFGDGNYYTTMPGESVDKFDGTGWTLSGGAKVITTTLANGKTTSVLDLPSGSQAVSPLICVANNYPTARSMVRDVVGSEGVFFYVAYEGTNTWTTPKNTGQFHGGGTAWSLSGSINLQPYNVTGWQPVRFVLKAGGTKSDFQVYNLYVDPRMAV